MLRRSDRILHYCIFIRSLRWILYNRNHTQLTRHNSYEPIHFKSYHWVILSEKYWMKPTVRHKWLTKKTVVLEKLKQKEINNPWKHKIHQWWTIMKLLLRIQKIYKTSTRKRNESTSAKIFSIPSLLCSGQGYTTSNKSKVKNIMTSSFFTGCSHDLDVCKRVCAPLTKIAQIITKIFIPNGTISKKVPIKDWV